MKRGISETQRKRASGFKGGERKPGGGNACKSCGSCGTGTVGSANRNGARSDVTPENKRGAKNPIAW